MKNLKIRLGIFSLLAILAVSVFLTSCEQEYITTTQNGDKVENYTTSDLENFNSQSEILKQINAKKEYVDNDEFYELNPNVENKINYNEYILLSESVQRAIYGKMPNEKRLSFWKEKLSNDLMQKDLFIEVKQLIQKFINNVDEDTFKSNLSSFTDLLGNLDEADKNYFIMFHNNTGVNKKTQTNNNKSIILKAGSCVANWCILCYQIDAGCSSECTPEDWGCGWFWTQPCTKTCTPQ